jgi:ribose-phosphate pyrophosphokinase
MALLAGPASVRLGAEVSALLQAQALSYDCQRFPGGEAQADLGESVRGRDVYLLQSTSPATDIVATGGFARLMLIDAHTPAIEGFFDGPIDHLTAVPLLAQAARCHVADASVVVAPDLGAVKLAREYGRLLQAPMAFVHKTRLSGHEVEAHGVIGDVRGRTPVIVDDMLSTGGTIEAAIGALRQAGALEPVTVVVTHALLAGHARDVLRRLPIAHLITGDTVVVEDTAGLPVTVTSVAPLIAAAIRRDHYDESFADLRVQR